MARKGERKPAPELALKTVPEAVPTTVVVELPLGDVDKGEYLSRHVESRLKTRQQQLAMKRVVRGLQKAGAATKDGRPVQRPGEMVRWLLEQISDSE